MALIAGLLRVALITWIRKVFLLRLLLTHPGRRISVILLSRSRRGAAGLRQRRTAGPAEPVGVEIVSPTSSAEHRDCPPKITHEATRRITKMKSILSGSLCDLVDEMSIFNLCLGAKGRKQALAISWSLFR